MWPFTTAQPSKDPIDNSSCPVTPSSREAWLNSRSIPSGIDGQQRDPSTRLSKEREVSSIPRWFPPRHHEEQYDSNAVASSSTTKAQFEPSPTSCPVRSNSSSESAPPSTQAHVSHLEEKWVYPSPASFYNALKRKEREPDAKDMPIVVPIHNAVNERVWEQVLQWEREAAIREGRDPQKIGSKLVSFVGKPKELSPRARWKSFIGYMAPFDRHDWIVDRPLESSATSNSTSSSIRIRYVIDFYTGRLPAILSPDRGVSSKDLHPEEMFRPNLAFFIDCRPALDNWEGVRMRVHKFWSKIMGGDTQKPATA